MVIDGMTTVWSTLLSRRKHCGMEFHNLAEVRTKVGCAVIAGVKMEFVLDVFLLKLLVESLGPDLKVIFVVASAVEINGEPADRDECDGACLHDFVDQYLAALVARDPARLPPAWRQRFCDYFKRRIVAGEARYFVAEANGAVVATAAAIVRDGYPLVINGRQTGYILGVSVLPAYRKRGLAKELTRRSLEWLKSLGCKRIRLHASAAGRAIYESFGFVPSSEMELIV